MSPREEIEFMERRNIEYCFATPEGKVKYYCETKKQAEVRIKHQNTDGEILYSLNEYKKKYAE